ncbi:tagatose-6-phosphate kinase [Lentibacillus kapialis]|uniref:Tagatose-6-phosphate kinase n=1 Tax=Lentibacillus kapialis TaxID=340214 RepID=A0A917V074_9BACI|nr:hexose kinase [Lentibacillus kapialis]GGK03818.1 tagatose-6-phosphate kinase [Lentibacillus kapialis]
MILTITLNPSVDISYKLDELALDTVNRVSDVSKTAGGKGLNVTRVIQQLGEDVAASGFLGGSLGDFIRAEIAGKGIQDDFVSIAGETRNCIAVIHDGQQTEILESGPEISADEAGEFLKHFTDVVQKVDLVTISGSLPKGLEPDFYGQLVETANQHGTRVLLDTKGELLSHTIAGEEKPFLIKPNEEELADLWGETVTGETAIMSALESQRFSDIPWVVVTTGAAGAYVKHDAVIYKVSAPKVDAVNPVGSGDAVIAGFAAGLSRGLTDTELIKFGLAMGVLNAMEARTGSINPENISWCVDQIHVETMGG